MIVRFCMLHQLSHNCGVDVFRRIGVINGNAGLAARITHNKTNMTVFRGKKYLVLEKYSDYQSGGKYPSFKIKTLIDFGFTKLVLRIRATGYTSAAVEAAELAFPTVSANIGKNIYDEHEKAEINGFARLYCYNYDGEFMGALEDFRHWFKYDLVCFHGCPRGVLYARSLNKYLGFSHRGMAAFGIGDRLFDEAWEPTWDDLKIDWVVDYCKAVGYTKIPASIQEAKTFVRLKDMQSGKSVVSFVPFIARGNRVIASKGEAIQAARNFSIYLS